MFTFIQHDLSLLIAITQLVHWQVPNSKSSSCYSSWQRWQWHHCHSPWCNIILYSYLVLACLGCNKKKATYIFWENAECLTTVIFLLLLDVVVYKQTMLHSTVLSDKKYQMTCRQYNSQSVNLWTSQLAAMLRKREQKLGIDNCSKCNFKKLQSMNYPVCKFISLKNDWPWDGLSLHCPVTQTSHHTPSKFTWIRLITLSTVIVNILQLWQRRTKFGTEP